MADPWMKFYPSDWRADPKLRLVSMAARGLWMEMICLMHEAEPYGDLRVAGVALDETRLARMVGEVVEDVTKWLAELREAEVFSVRKNGVIYSRRMEKDENRRRKMRENGKKGGNPSLRKDGENPALDNQGDNTQKPEARSQIEYTPSDEGVGTGPNPGDLVADDPPKVSGLEAHRTDTAFRQFVAAAERQPAWTVPKALNRQRRTQMTARIREHGLDGWGQVIERAERSRFLTGQGGGDRPFALSLDWLLKPANLLKVLEGNYDDRAANPNSAGSSGRHAQPPENGGRLGAFDRLAERLAGHAAWPDAGGNPEPGPEGGCVIDADFTRLTG
jgi:hypothetical protein